MQGDYSRKASEFFSGQLAAWDQEGVDDIGKLSDYYNGLNDVYSNGTDVTIMEREAIQKIQNILRD